MKLFRLTYLQFFLLVGFISLFGVNCVINFRVIQLTYNHTCVTNKLFPENKNKSTNPINIIIKNYEVNPELIIQALTLHYFTNNFQNMKPKIQSIIANPLAEKFTHLICISDYNFRS